MDSTIYACSFYAGRVRRHQLL
jgi:hypothetical protein